MPNGRGKPEISFSFPSSHLYLLPASLQQHNAKPRRRDEEKQIKGLWVLTCEAYKEQFPLALFVFPLQPTWAAPLLLQEFRENEP